MKKTIKKIIAVSIILSMAMFATVTTYAGSVSRTINIHMTVVAASPDSEGSNETLPTALASKKKDEEKQNAFQPE